MASAYTPKMKVLPPRRPYTQYIYIDKSVHYSADCFALPILSTVTATATLIFIISRADLQFKLATSTAARCELRENPFAVSPTGEKRSFAFGKVKKPENKNKMQFLQHHKRYYGYKKLLYYYTTMWCRNFFFGLAFLLNRLLKKYVLCYYYYYSNH